MLIEKKEYTELLNALEEMRDRALNTKLPIGKYKGKSIQNVMQEDKQYIYWLIRETTLRIDPRLLGFELPTKDSILDLLDVDYDGKNFIQINLYDYPAEYDSWNLGHYGCISPECVKEARSEIYKIKYSFDDIVSDEHDFIDILQRKYPYIKWTKEYLVTLFKDDSH